MKIMSKKTYQQPTTDFVCCRAGNLMLGVSNNLHMSFDDSNDAFIPV